ncbi:NAD-dependent epimerase/dehydratase family protein [Pelagicoccus mobilis]|uniref:NAD-dependent epimerase/dehydratase family protein n=1 Tax=Pelagicoccus mobilis TaxID=415221 RepID=A0A934VU58_9BACT|nr:NAD(P)-dependent oxidoreductase [Pelagicoccus mobilis]MBK1880418.1 NAD-dependent epimerase/dehydratase family protein [Pelagicoccus mobilis]
MKVLVTGAAGLLGRAVCGELLGSGIELVAVDRGEGEGLGYPIVKADVLDRASCYSMAQGCDCVVHLANCTDWLGRSAQEVYVDNVSMDINVFQAAVESGVRRIVFASSVQLLTGFRLDVEREEHEILFERLPADSSAKLYPRNPYSLSKAAGEQMLDGFVDRYGISAVSIRFPILLENGLASLREIDPNPRKNAFDLYAYLSTASAGDLVRRCALAGTEGHRRYFPAAKGNLHGLTPAEVYRERLEGLELRCPLEALDRLVDCSDIEADTGWTQPEV